VNSSTKCRGSTWLPDELVRYSLKTKLGSGRTLSAVVKMFISFSRFTERTCSDPCRKAIETENTKAIESHLSSRLISNERSSIISTVLLATIFKCAVLSIFKRIDDYVDPPGQLSSGIADQSWPSGLAAYEPKGTSAMPVFEFTE